MTGQSSKGVLVLEKNLGTKSWVAPTQLYLVAGATWTPYLGQFNGSGSIPDAHRPLLVPSNDRRSVALQYPDRIETALAAKLDSTIMMFRIRKAEFWTGEIAWARDDHSIAFSFGRWSDPTRHYGAADYLFWTANRDGTGRKLVATIHSQRALGVAAYDARTGSIFYWDEGGESGTVGGLRRIDIRSSDVSAITGLQNVTFRYGFTFSKDFQQAYWAESSGRFFTFNLATGMKTVLWIVPRPFAAVDRAIVAPNDKQVVVTVNRRNAPGFKTYLIDLLTRNGILLIDDARYQGVAPEGWSPDSTQVWLEPQCDHGCGPHLGNAGQYYIDDVATHSVVTFYRSQRFDPEGETIDWLRFIAWLRVD